MSVKSIFSKTLLTSLVPETIKNKNKSALMTLKIIFFAFACIWWTFDWRNVIHCQTLCRCHFFSDWVNESEQRWTDKRLFFLKYFFKLCNAQLASLFAGFSLVSWKNLSFRVIFSICQHYSWFPNVFYLQVSANADENPQIAATATNKTSLFILMENFFFCLKKLKIFCSFCQFATRIFGKLAVNFKLYNLMRG